MFRTLWFPDPSQPATHLNGARYVSGCHSNAASCGPVTAASRRGPAGMFTSQQANQDRLPVALLSGFLGSGKTTLVNALLRDPRMAGTAVAVNEFGQIPLDRQLIDHGADRTVVLANGCLCCNLAGDMEEAVMRLFSRRQHGEVPDFARLLIEPSGLADPAPVAQAILRNPVLSRVFRLEAIVTTVDAMFGHAQLARHPETRKQVALADCLVVTKSDMAGEAAVMAIQAELRDLSPLAPIHLGYHGDIDAASLFPTAFFGLTEISSTRSRSGLFAEAVEADPNHASRVSALSLTAGRPLHWRDFDAWLRRVRIEHAERLLRMKGMLNIAGVAGPIVVQGVHHVLHTPVELDRWPDADRRSRLVLITEGADTLAIRASWADALPAMSAH
jgi:G3E family GTPase